MDRYAKTSRNRVKFSVLIRMVQGSFCSRRLNGGGGSRGATRLYRRIAVSQGKYREFFATSREIVSVLS
jgi:hypothetical protein